MLSRLILNHERGGIALMGILVVLAAAVPILNLAVPPESAFQIGRAHV